MLDPGLGGVQVQAAILDVLVDLLCGFEEGVLDVFTSESSARRREREGGEEGG